MTEEQQEKTPVSVRTVVTALGLVTLVTLVAMSFVAEYAVRYRERHREVMPDAHTTMYYRTQRVRHALVRDFDYFGWVSVNRHGFRGKDVTIEKPSGVFRIMVVGASTTFDTSVTPDDDAWPFRLEHWLAEQVPGLDVEVINAGVSGYTVLDNIIRLQTQLYQFEPDLIVLFQTHNDLSGSLGTPLAPDPHRPGAIEPVTPWSQWLERHSLFYNKLRLRFEVTRRLSGPPPGAVASPPPYRERIDAGAADFERSLKIFLATAGALDIPVVLPSVVNVSGGRVPGPDQAEELAAWARTQAVPVEYMMEGYDRYRETIRSVAEGTGTPYIDTSTFGLVGWEYYSHGDPVHFSNAGADRMGEHMARALVEAGVVPVPGADDAGGR